MQKSPKLYRRNRMNKAYDRIVWKNYTDTSTPLNATNLNKMDLGLNEIDNRVVGFDTTKANQSDLLQSLKQVAYNSTTGVFTFTYWNGSTLTVDLNIEKIPVSFSMSPQGVITMTTADGTQYTCDVSTLIKTYTFTDSPEIDFTVVTDASGNKTVTAAISNGSIAEEKLEVHFLANCQAAQLGAENARDSAQEYASNCADAVELVQEAVGVGTFSLSSGGHLMFTDNAIYDFEVDDYGHLTVEVV